MTDAFEEAKDQLEEALTNSMKCFAVWMKKNWKFPATEAEWSRTFAEPYPGDDIVKAHNEGVCSVTDALDAFLDEYGY